MDLKARLCTELDNSVTAELLVTYYVGDMVIWTQNYSCSFDDATCARMALEQKVKEVNATLGVNLRIRTYKVLKNYEETYEPVAVQVKEDLSF